MKEYICIVCPKGCHINVDENGNISSTLQYKDNYYVTAFCELRSDIRHFKFQRIVNIK